MRMADARESAAGAERVLVVHAHPDDESITTGGTLATLVDRGALVTLVTCTRGERGEVIPEHLRHLEGTPGLVRERERELAEALAALGVTDHRWLGAQGARREGLPPRRYADSGMRWGASGRAEPLPDPAPDSLCAAELGEVAADLASVILDVRPDVVVSYGADGGYGHPDHVRAAEAARRAASVLDVPFCAIASPEEPASIEVDVAPVLERKRRALRAHRTQLLVGETDIRYPDGRSEPITTVERYRRVLADPVADRALTTGALVLSMLAAFVVGAGVGAIGTMTQQYAAPVGLVAALFAVAALLAGLRVVFDGRLVAAAAAAGVLLAAGLFALPGGGGSVHVPANAAGYTWVFGPVVLAALVLGWPRSVPRRTP